MKNFLLIICPAVALLTSCGIGNGLCFKTNSRVNLCSANSGGGGGGGATSFGTFTLTSAGGIDTAFGGSGIGSGTFPYGTNAAAYGAVKQSDGKIVAVGFGLGMDNNEVLMRFYADGTKDTTYGTAGTASTDFFIGSADFGYAGLIQPDDSVIVVGSNDLFTGNNACSVSRYRTDGFVDTTFNAGGLTWAYFGNTAANCYGGVLQPDGKIVAVGYATNGSDKPAIVRFTSTGSLDTSTLINLGATTTNSFRAVTLLADGSLVAAGYVHTGATDDTFIAKFNSSLALDTNFGGSGTGYRTFDAGGGTADRGHSIVADGAGNFYVGGYSAGGANQFMVVKFTSAGIVETTFGTAGVAVKDVTAGSDIANAIILQADGKIVLGGYAGAAAAAQNFTLVRFLTNGSVDTAFGTAGAYQIDASGVANRDQINALLAYDSTSLIGIGLGKVGVSDQFTIAKFK